MSTPFVLPQYQGSYYDLQRQQALAQALMQGALTPQQPAQAAAVGPYQVQARMSPIAPLSQLAQGLLAAKTGQQASQGLNNLGQQQWGSLVSMLGGGNGQSPQPNPDSAAVGGVGGSTANPFAGSDGGDGSAGAGAGRPVPVSAAGPAGPNVGVGGGGSPLNPLGMNPGMAAYMMMQAPDKYWEAQSAAYKPSDVVAAIRAAGFDPNSPLGRQIAQQSLAKSLYQAPTSIRGQTYADMNGIHTLPADAPEGFQKIQDQQTGQWSIQPVQGGSAAVAANSQAKASGPATYNLQKVWNPATQQYEMQPATNVAAAAGAPIPGSAAIPQIESHNNPNAVSPKGAVGAWQVMPNTSANPGFGVQPAANNSRAELDRVGQDYYGAMQQRYGDPALAAVAYNMGPGATDQWLKSGGDFAKLPQQTQLYLGRWTAANAVNSRAGAPPSGGGAMAAEPPLGATPAANASQSAAPESMQKDWESMQPTRASAPSVLDSLDKMIALAKQKSPLMAGPLATNEIATALSPNAAEYEKQRANVITNLAGSGSTDAARALQGEAVPDYGKPTSAQLDGLQTQRNQVVAKQLRAQLLTGAYNAGDAKTYTTLASGFDQNVSPSMVPLLTMPAGAARAQALQQALKANPSLRPKLDWAVQNGILK